MRYHCPPTTAHRRGFTLVELLVAIAVISLLAAIALPTVKNTLREQKVKRSASTVQSFIEEARARAITTGGGGVIIDRLGTTSLLERSQSVRMRLADVPPPYTGDRGGSVAVFGFNASATPTPYALWFDPSAAQVTRSQQDLAAGRTQTLINIGDIVRLGSAGLELRVVALLAGSITRRDAYGIPDTVIPDAQAASWTLMQVASLESNSDLRRLQSQRFPYTILRQPRPAIAAPLQLGEGTVIDLTASGMGRQGNEFSPLEIAGNYLDETQAPFRRQPATPPVPNPNDYQSVLILFSQRGDVSEVYYSSIPSGTVPVLQSFPATGDIHLLVGRAGELKVEPGGQLEDNDPAWLSDEAKDGTTPLLDPDSVWLTIKASTGEVLASPVSQPTIVPAPASIATADQRARVRNTIGQARNAAMLSRDGGSL